MGDEEVDLKKRLTETKNPSFEGLFCGPDGPHLIFILSVEYQLLIKN
jgi:hypothetical protein